MRDITILNMLCGQLHALGVTLPDRTRNALAVWQAANEAHADTAVAELGAALEDGRLTPDNARAAVHEAAQRLTAQHYATQINRDLSGFANRIGWRALFDAAPTIYAELRPHFDQAAAVIHQVAQHFRPDTGAEQVVAASSDAIHLWKQRGDATATLDAIRGVRVQLGTGQQHAAWWIAAGPDVDVDQAQALYTGGNGNVWHRLAHAGYRLTLNDDDQAAAIIEQHRARVERAATEARTARDRRLLDGDRELLRIQQERVRTADAA